MLNVFCADFDPEYALRAEVLEGEADPDLDSFERRLVQEQNDLAQAVVAIDLNKTSKK